MNQVNKTFGPSNSPNNHTKCMRSEEIANASKSQDNLTIAWGNWGKNPNALKNGAPTPGIGIRRRFEKEFKIVVTCEHLTSQNCPCCGWMDDFAGDADAPICSRIDYFSFGTIFLHCFYILQRYKIFGDGNKVNIITNYTYGSFYVDLCYYFYG